MSLTKTYANKQQHIKCCQFSPPKPCLKIVTKSVDMSKIQKLQPLNKLIKCVHEYNITMYHFKFLPFTNTSNIENKCSSLEVCINVKVSTRTGLCNWRGTTHYARLLIFSNTLLKEVGLAFQRNVVHEVKRVLSIPYLKNTSQTLAAKYYTLKAFYLRYGRSHKWDYSVLQNSWFHIFNENSFSALTLLVGWQEGHPACKQSCTSSPWRYSLEHLWRDRA